MKKGIGLIWDGVIPSIEDFLKYWDGTDFLRTIEKLSPGISHLFTVRFDENILNNKTLLECAINYACRNAHLNGRGDRPDLIDLYFGFIANHICPK